ncbi:hypothetical protein OU798_07355 [Prolixibacteraceae bacterium Z1-6]|uniref:Uncharacterized protein n=1 Tax=Draconibacterium aestuarii TaxID=2998507 RepID=A0A9X3F479_9BACT|nr:hypothetical protein [Prolixibacteraceae bacterium Z1-6]
MGIFSNNPEYFRGGSFVGRAPVPLQTTVYYNVEEQNEIVQQWIPKVRTQLKANARQFPDGKEKSFVQRPGRTEKKLHKSITSRTRKEFGEIYSITFQFERHGVFVHKGVSRGHGVGNERTAFEWFNPVLEKHIPELANRIAEHNANAAVNATRMKIN